MTKTIPMIEKYMTTTPFTVEKETSLLEAAKLMQKEGFRHLPVTYQGQVEGILSATDIHLMSSLQGFDIEQMKVYQAYTPNPMKVSPQAPIDEVAREMVQHKYGCMLVEDHGRLVGIFTWIDALKAMDHLLQTRLK